jgi:hypothetical protein
MIMGMMIVAKAIKTRGETHRKIRVIQSLFPKNIVPSSSGLPEFAWV